MESMKKYLAVLLTLAVVAGLGAVCAFAAPEASMEQMVLLDCDEAVMTVESYDPVGEWGPTFELLLENKSDRDLYFSLDNVAVSGVMCDPFWGESVPAGKKTYSDLSWYPEDLAAVGINYVASVSASASVWDDETYEDVYTNAVSWELTLGETDLPPAEPLTFGDFGPVPVLTDGDVVMTVVDYSPTGNLDDGPALTLCLENKTDNLVYFTMEDVSVNGFVCDPYWGEVVAPGAVAYSQCEWWQDDLEQSHIETMESVEFTAQAMDDDSWEELASAEITLDLTGEAAPAEAPAEEAPAEEAPAEEAPAGPAEPDGEVTALMGATEGNVYTNDFFGVTCTLPENWRFFTGEEMAALTGAAADAVSGSDMAQYVEQYLRDKQNAYVMAAVQDDGLLNINVMVESISGLGAYLTGDDILDLTLAQMGIGEDGDASAMGLEGATMTKQHFTVDGQDLAGLRLEYVDSSTGVEIPLYGQLVYIMGEDYVLQITMTSVFDEGGLDTIAGLFTIAE